MLLPEHGTVAQALALLALPLLGASLGLAASRTPLAAIRWCAIQALAVAGAGVMVATLRPSWDQLAAAALALLVQAAALPLILYAVSRRGHDVAHAAPYPARGARAMGALAFGLIVAAFLVVRPLHVPGTAVSGPLLPMTIALWLVGAQLGVLGAGSTLRAAGMLGIADGVLLLGLATGTGLCPLLGLGYGLDGLVLGLLLTERALLGPGPLPHAAGPGQVVG